MRSNTGACSNADQSLSVTVAKTRWMLKLHRSIFSYAVSIYKNGTLMIASQIFAKTVCHVDRNTTVVAGQPLIFFSRGCLPLEARMHAYFYFMVTLSFPRELLLIQQS